MRRQVQVAVYDALNNDATLSAKINGIWTTPPVNNPYPYITIGQMNVNKDNVHGNNGFNFSLTLRIYDKNNGYINLQSIESDINRIINRSVLTLSSGVMTGCMFDNSFSSQEDDIRISTIYYKIFTEE